LKGASGAIVAVHLEPTIEGPVRYYDGYEATPRPDGSFYFTEIPAGDYRITVESESQLSMAPPGQGGNQVRQHLPGFTTIFPADMPSGVVHLRGGEHRKGIVIDLTHRLSICGRVTQDVAPRDQWGRDIGPPQIAPADTSVIYFRLNPEFNVLEAKAEFGTDKDGSFRITDLAPGTYYMKVGTSNETWFPGSTSFSMAKPIVVGTYPPAGCDTDILVPNSFSGQAALTSISIDGGDKSHRYRAALLERNAEGVGYFWSLAAAYLDKPMTAGSTTTGIYARAGTFEAVLYEESHMGGTVWGDAPTQKVIFDSQTVTLKPTMDAGSQNTIAFKPHPMASIQGDLRLENVTRDDFCPYCQTIYVSILREGNGEFQTVNLSPGNHFDFHDVSPGEYQLFVYTTRPDKVFLKSLVAAGQAYQGRRFTIGDTKFVRVTVTLSGNLAQAAGHISPDARHAEHWETEGMRPRGTVSGKVVGDEGTVYTVQLLPVVYNNAPIRLATQTAIDGSFHFDSVTPGAYLLRAQGKDSVPVDYGAPTNAQQGTPLLIAAGAHLHDLTLRAPHRGSICGHVTNAIGEPQPSLKVLYRTDTQTFTSQMSAIPIDNEGYFRIDGLLATDYFLAAMRPAAGDFLIALSADGELSGFKPFHLEDGQDVGCGGASPVELHVSSDSRHFTVAGAVTGELPARTGDRFEAELEPAEDMHFFWPQTRLAQLSDDHRFHFDTIPPGHYRIRVYGLFGKKPSNSVGFVDDMRFEFAAPLRHLVASQVITVADKNLTDLALSPIYLPTVSGLVTIPNVGQIPNTLKMSDLTIALVPHSKNGISTIALKDEGSGHAGFEIGAVDPGEYELRLQSTRGYFVNSYLFIQYVKLNGKDIDPLAFHITGGAPVNLQIELGNKMAALQPHISVDKAFVVPAVPLAEWCSRSDNFQIWLLPAEVLDLSDDHQPRQAPRYEIGWSMGNVCKGIRSWATQGFDRTMENLTPGKYYAIVVQSGQPGVSMGLGVQGQGDFTADKRMLWKELARIAKPVTLHPGERLDLNLDDKTIEVLRIFAKVGAPATPEDLRGNNGQACCSR
jgi:protocatechuate 3,4-dioxygenase beta subunit